MRWLFLGVVCLHLLGCVSLGVNTAGPADPDQVEIIDGIGVPLYYTIEWEF